MSCRTICPDKLNLSVLFFSMLQARRDEELDGIGNLMQLYKFNGRDVMSLDNNVYFCTR